MYCVVNHKLALKITCLIVYVHYDLSTQRGAGVPGGGGTAAAPQPGEEQEEAPAGGGQPTPLSDHRP